MRTVFGRVWRGPVCQIGSPLRPGPEQIASLSESPSRKVPLFKMDETPNRLAVEGSIASRSVDISRRHRHGDDTAMHKKF